MIAYEEAAVRVVRSPAFEHLICYGYFKLKDYDGAVRACTKTIENTPGKLQARYWRGRTYQNLGQLDAALEDLTAVADSEDSLRTSAGRGLSMIYFNRRDIRGGLNVLNKYTHLYDPEINSRDNIAVSYNNRCYAYMELGELEKALDDCTTSLKHGSLPDAYRKQMELTKRLRAHETGL
jgi:tetratricopeptide (TPR) repeat protein